MATDGKKLSTIAVHGGEPRKKAGDAITMPIQSTATYVFEDTAELRAHFERRIEREEYGRYGNPTVSVAEQKIAALDGAGGAALFSSGMAAITTTLLAMLRSGQHVVMTSDCYRRTRQFVTRTLGKFGVEATLVEPGDYEALEAAIRPGETRLIIAESPTNPYLHVADLEKLVEIRDRHRGVKIMIDSTFATPINQKPLDFGVDLVVHSATKYLGGHNDLLAGAICGNAGIIDAIRDFRGVLGSVVDANTAYMLIRGIKTLDLRVHRQNDSALQIARWLEAHPKVERVYYPGLESHASHEVASRQMHGFGGVVSFLVEGDLDDVSRFIDACEIPQIGPSLGGVESLIEQPALMSFYELTTEQRLDIGIRDNLVRFAIGIEDTQDLIDDLEQALEEV
ncbi:aminotransferase class I/II-fold pyridoxal phosphate-dependent enzyme [Persicimonas caeni]|uniref:Aminotransferase class I/II-fold pyridoxal phosphate-dependent enzyme n=1 Tax=Persicimonas caeni TaxID=2292766 RepID=A0A4Y6PR09_PERCE|nr:aminotransferase class I/II-fold pyridoxal phosphate-dependent enzyme [Persicimonas caeni]QDG50761.1 aminotransferase class I/II-fold pyridoxal phosphate-dependent enzyme [Persicimonas caeni]QED31982.1 aminotransferase class I/II-fold pyridoxal phosphate-dependent enzyme [Persicimonas caeni]